MGTDRADAVNLEASEPPHIHILSILADAVLIHQNGKIVFANAAAAEVHGAESVEQLIGTDAIDTVHPDDRARILSRRQDLKNGKALNINERKGLRIDGTEFFCETRGSKITWNGEPAIVAIIRDITERKQAEQALRESEARYRDLIEGSDLGIQITSRDKERIFANRACAKLFGYASPDEICAIARQGLAANYEREKVIRYRESLFKDGPSVSNFESDGLRKDGSIIPLQVFSRRIEWEGEDAIQRTFIDLTDRKKAERALQESEERYRRISELSPDGIVVHTDGNIEFANQSFAQILGAGSPDELIGIPMLDFVDPELHEEALERRKKANAGEKVALAETRFLRCDGAMTHVERVVAPIIWQDKPSFLLIVRDITERKRAEAALRERETQLRILADVSPVMISYIDRDRIIRFSNKAFAARHGSTPDEIIGKHQTEYWGKDVHRDVNNLIEKTLAGNVTTNVGVREHADGTKHHHFVTRAPHFDDDGSVLGYFNIILDMTDQKRTEDQLRQAQKMEAIGQLTGGVAHDFNNLLAVILGNLELIAERAEEPAIGRMAQSAITASNRGAVLTQRLLAYSRKQTLSPKLVDLNELVSGMTELLRRTLGEPIEIDVACGGNLWRCEADPGQLESAILNLALNARDAMPQGGKLTIETSNVKLTDSDVAAWNDVLAGEYVTVSVFDTGTGMSRDVIDHAFEPFFTTKDVGSGSGLGLSMVQGFINQSGGHVAIDSKEGAGTTVKLYLPRKVGTYAPARQSPKEKDPLSQGEKVLVVEDDPDVRKLTVDLLADLGYATVEAADGQEAIEALKRTDEIDLLFTDVVLPGGMSGIQIAEEAIEQFPGIKILLTSGYAETVLDRHGSVAKNSQLIQKPYRKATLAQTVRAVLDQPVD